LPSSRSLFATSRSSRSSADCRVVRFFVDVEAWAAELQRGVDELMKIVQSHNGKPEFGPRPSRAWPAVTRK